MNPHDPDVLVVGAGPTGLTLACSLVLQGVTVRVLDGAPGPAVTSRANFLHARGSEVLDRIGALGDLPANSLRAMQITAYLGDRPVMRLRFGDPGLRTAAPPMVISQARVEESLRDRLLALGAEPEWNRRVTHLAVDDDGVSALTADGERVRAHWVVGCDGTGSYVRTAAGIGFPGVKLSERFLLADVRLSWDLDRRGTTGWIHPTGMIGVMPMPSADAREDLWRVIAYDPDYTDAPDEGEILDRIRQILPQRTGQQVEVIDSQWLSLFSVHRRLADTYRRGRLLIAGDAAHAHAPFGGQGMLTGIGDAENLAWKLALVIRSGASADLLDTYEAERRPLATDVLRGTSAATQLNITGNPVGRLLRDRVLMPLIGLRPIQRWITYTTSQLWVSYRKGPLGGKGTKPRPGDRMPDRQCARADATPTRLHAELGANWAVLAPNTVDIQRFSLTASMLADRLSVLHHEASGVMLIRPDAHLAWRGAPEQLDGLDHWLQAIRRTGRAAQ